ncbi:MAG: nucleoside triphosphate pyrophosphohydrolase [Bacteroidales bacterium]|nr:nucleoside triphosphate pyrophosphohydrolase [Bacteroidales bacterium]MBR6932058.1 nucleoside triphosphate pyrophosphohydrolase [Bacteroidales bacterium]
MHTKEEKLAAFGRLLDIMEELRAKCPWNAAQTIDSLRPMTLEEVYELSDAVLKKDDEDLKKELGDVLLHIVFYSRIAEEQGKYDIADVAEKVSDKMVYRHPHVFSTVEVADADEVSHNWEMLKTKEKGGNKRVLSGVPESLPSILKAYFMQDKARGVGFDWEEKSQVWDKVKEELGEYQAELEAMDAEDGHVEPSQFAPAEGSSDGFKAAYVRAEEELGDFLFAVINAARLYGLNPDTALNRACDKFRRRFTYLEEQTIRKGRMLTDMTLAEMDEIWDEGKAKGL